MIRKEKWTIRAEAIAKKAAGDDYIEDGGYIRDWLCADIENALIETRLEALREGAEVISLAKLEIDSLQRQILKMNPAFQGRKDGGQ